MSTEFLKEEKSPGQLFSPMSTWANLGGSVNVDSLAAPILNAGGLNVFVRNSSDKLDVCSVQLTGTAGTWTSLDKPVRSSPSVAVARDSGILGVICMSSSQGIDVHYVDPSTSYKIHTSNLNRVGLDSGVAFNGQVKIARNNNKALEVFALDRNGNMWHRTETNTSVVPGDWNKGWEKLGSGFDVSVKEFDVIRINGNQVPTILQIVALTTDRKVCQAKQVEGQPGKYHSFAQVGDSSQYVFSGSPAATFGPLVNSTIYAIYNSSTWGGKNPLTYYADMGQSQSQNQNPSWESIDHDAAFPAAGDSVVLATTSDGRTHLVWMDDNLQVYMASRENVGSKYWSMPPDLVGNPGSSFMGTISAIPNDNAVGLFQSDGNNKLWHINFLPT